MVKVVLTLSEILACNTGTLGHSMSFDIRNEAIGIVPLRYCSFKRPYHNEHDQGTTYSPHSVPTSFLTQYIVYLIRELFSKRNEEEHDFLVMRALSILIGILCRFAQFICLCMRGANFKYQYAIVDLFCQEYTLMTCQEVVL